MFQNGFPEYLNADVKKVLDLIISKTKSEIKMSVTQYSDKYSLDGYEINIPGRFYHSEVSEEFMEEFNIQQKMIFHCIYSRSNDGYVRQKHIHQLLLMECEDWTLPYIIKLCDEYVIEILETVYEILKDKDTTSIKRICNENYAVMTESYDRMVSYWNEYYRYKHYNLYEYVGFKLFYECFGIKLKKKRGKFVKLTKIS